MSAISKHLTPTGNARQAKYEERTFPGMAHWATSGPANKTCRECRFWAPAGDKSYYKRDLHGELKNRRCRKYYNLTHDVNGQSVPHFALACKYFSEVENPPGIDRPERKIKVRKNA
jgi:hypothetical protein